MYLFSLRGGEGLLAKESLARTIRLEGDNNRRGRLFDFELFHIQCQSLLELAALLLVVFLFVCFLGGLDFDLFHVQLLVATSGCLWFFCRFVCFTSSLYHSLLQVTQGLDCYLVSVTRVRLQEIPSGSIYKNSTKNKAKLSLVFGHF